LAARLAQLDDPVERPVRVRAGHPPVVPAPDVVDQPLGQHQGGHGRPAVGERRQRLGPVPHDPLPVGQLGHVGPEPGELLVGHLD
jgi:hypothetical protein